MEKGMNNMSKKKKNSVQKLIDFERFTKYGVRTDKAEFAFFAVEPTNISVMSSASIDTKVHHLKQTENKKGSRRFR